MILIFISVEFFDNFIITSGFLDREGRHGRISCAAQGRQEALHRLFPLPVLILLLPALKKSGWLKEIKLQTESILLGV